MKYHLIFYISKKTSYSEKAVKRRLITIDGEAHRVVCATEPSMLGEEVVNGLRVCPLTVIIGGLGSNGDDNLATVLSRVFSNSGLTLGNMRRLRAESGSDGYIIRYKSQILLALPDSPRDIEELCSDELLNFIKQKTSTDTASDEPAQETAEQPEVSEEPAVEAKEQTEDTVEQSEDIAEEQTEEAEEQSEDSAEQPETSDEQQDATE